MANTETSSSELARMHFRLPQEIKEVIERAAVLSGLNLTEFAVNALLKTANAVIEEHQLRTLTDRDRDLFLALLDREEGPNEALRKAAEDYKQYTDRL